MSSFNMAVRNMKKSVSDYVVYFLTLIAGVAIFYVFNSVGDQSIVKEISGAEYEIIEMLLLVLEMLSIGVAFVLGFLIIYANHFLIRRRKKEFGVYMLLGMGKKDISKILVSETVLVGTISLAVGLLLGVFASQFMSIIVGKLFQADMQAYHFVVSGGAVIKTVINFAVMYLIVVLFHSVTISKYQLIDLLSADKKTEKQVLKNPVLASVLFVIAAVSLGVAYYRVGFCTGEVDRDELITHILIGIVATLLLFWAISGFLLTILRKWKSMYYNDLNSFVIRQFCNSINSSAITMGIICLMLFVTICTFASGFSVAHQMQENVRNLTPVDYSIIYTKKKSIGKVLKKKGMDPKEWAADNSIEVPIYSSDSVTWATSLGSMIDGAREQFPAARWDTPENIMRVSDYNQVAELYGKENISLKENEFAVLCDFSLLVKLRNQTLEKGEVQRIGTYELVPASASCIESYIIMSGSNTNTGVIVVPDEVIENSKDVVKVKGHLMAGDYATNSEEKKKEIDEKLLKATEKLTAFDYTKANPLPPMSIGTKISIRESNNGLTIMVAFVVIYIGVVFLISSAALLALKALSESIDSVGKYVILKKIGSDTKMLRKALFGQVAVYFALPLLVACIHSVIGLRFAEFTLTTIMNEGVIWGACVTAIVMIILYGGYMLATYKGSKKIVGLEE